MNNYDKEKIYERLRNYHAHKLPEETAYETEGLRNKFVVIEEKVVMMIVRFVNEKEQYTDMASDVEILKTRLAPYSNSSKDKKLVESLNLKLDELSEIMLAAKP